MTETAAQHDDDQSVGDKSVESFSGKRTANQTIMQYLVTADLDMIRFSKRIGDYPDLSAPSDCCNCPAYVAVLNDRPEILKLLHEEEVDLSKPCDSLDFATPSFYCAYHGRTDCLRMLDELGYELENSPCNRFKDKVKRYIYKYNPPETAEAMMNVVFAYKHRAATKIQGMHRMRVARKRVEGVRQEIEEAQVKKAWTEAQDDAGTTYWYNERNGEQTYENPDPERFKTPEPEPEPEPPAPAEKPEGASDDVSANGSVAADENAPEQSEAAPDAAEGAEKTNSEGENEDEAPEDLNGEGPREEDEDSGEEDT